MGVTRKLLCAINLHGADVAGGRLARADLGRAILVTATLNGADLQGAKLRGANLAMDWFSHLVRGAPISEDETHGFCLCFHSRYS